MNDANFLEEILCDNAIDLSTQVVEDHYDDRRLILNGLVDNDLLEKMCLSILTWNQEDKDIPYDKRKKIYIYINSSGGDVVFGNNLISVMQLSKTPIVTVGFAKCYSMANYILAAGHERYCFPHTVVLYHDGEGGYYSSGNKGKDIQKFFDKLDDINRDFMIKHTNMSKEFLDAIKDREYYMFADEAKENGIVDKIIGVDCDLDEIL